MKYEQNEWSIFVLSIQFDYWLMQILPWLVNADHKDYSLKSFLNKIFCEFWFRRERSELLRKSIKCYSVLNIEYWTLADARIFCAMMCAGIIISPVLLCVEFTESAVKLLAQNKINTQNREIFFGFNSILLMTRTNCEVCLTNPFHS